MEFLGRVINNTTVKPAPDKVEAVMKSKHQLIKKEFQSFLGLNGCFREYIPNYASFARPLSDLLKKENNCKYEEKEKAAFEELKLNSDGPILILYSRSSNRVTHRCINIRIRSNLVAEEQH